MNNTSEISTQYQTTGASERLGYGLTVQARVAGHFYVDLSALLRRIGYQLDNYRVNDNHEYLERHQLSGDQHHQHA